LTVNASDIPIVSQLPRHLNERLFGIAAVVEELQPLTVWSPLEISGVVPEPKVGVEIAVINDLKCLSWRQCFKNHVFDMRVQDWISFKSLAAATRMSWGRAMT
jgi:hypothetical protein